MRVDPDMSGPEADVLPQYLDHHRETFLLKTEGLDAGQLRQKLPTSGLSLAGLTYHLTLVEDSWFQERFLGRPEAEPWASVDWDSDPDWEFRTGETMAPEELRRLYREACDRSRAAVAAADGLDQMSAVPNRGRHFSLRWLLLHMLEETARHNGHADLLREAIDGSVGE